jgi:hypothetical protein
MHVMPVIFLLISAAATIHRYLRQLGTVVAPGSVNAAGNALR